MYYTYTYVVYIWPICQCHATCQVHRMRIEITGNRKRRVPVRIIIEKCLLTLRWERVKKVPCGRSEGSSTVNIDQHRNGDTRSQLVLGNRFRGAARVTFWEGECNSHENQMLALPILKGQNFLETQQLSSKRRCIRYTGVFGFEARVLISNGPVLQFCCFLIARKQKCF